MSQLPNISLSFYMKSPHFSLSQCCPQLISPWLQQQLSPARQRQMTQAGIYESQTQRMQKCQLSYTATSPVTTTPQFTIRLENQWKQIVVGQNSYLLLRNTKLRRGSLIAPFGSFLSRLVWTDPWNWCRSYNKFPFLHLTKLWAGRALQLPGVFVVQEPNFRPVLTINSFLAEQEKRDCQL